MIENTLQIDPESVPPPQYDLSIVGGGIFGLSLGYAVLASHPEKKVCILEKGLLPSGASSKNAGMGTFLCYTEFIDDVRHKGLDFAVRTVSDSFRGLLMLFNVIDNDPEIIKLTGGYDLIIEKDLHLLQYLDFINKELFFILKVNLFEIRNEKISEYGFDPNLVKALVYRKYDWQINTGRLFMKVLKKFQQMNGIYITGAEVTSFKEIEKKGVSDFENSKNIRVFLKSRAMNKMPNAIDSDYTVFCINSFGSQLLEKSTIVPAREQVLITKPIDGLALNANFLLELSYYYFRQINGRLLFGGGRHLDLDTEETVEMTTTDFFRKHLVMKIKELFPNLNFEVDYYWTGIIGFDNTGKSYRIDNISKGVYNVFGCNGSGMTLCFLTAEKTCKLIFGQKAKL
jgi:gamma-glutamylputrescine oxidase